jgi:hypothetical protein
MISKEAKRIYDLNYTKVNADRIKVVKKVWKNKNQDKIRAWKLKWATSENGKASAKKYRDKSPKAYMRLYIAGAKRRNIDFDLSEKQFTELLYMDCVYCGQSANPKRNGIDRVANELGYISDNVVPCCFKCNQMKGKLSNSDFFKHILKIIEYGT